MMDHKASTSHASTDEAMTVTVVAAAAISALLAALIASTTPITATAQVVGCSASARLLRFACAADLRDDYFTATAQCIDAAVPEDMCFEAAAEALDEGRDECRKIFRARLEVCEALNDRTHDPDFAADFAASFVDPTQIGISIAPNPYLPLVAGNRWIYADEEETVSIEVTTETKLIDGVRCLTVSNIVTEDGVLIEDTDDWYAQDTDGNVWHCGEIAQNYELFDGDDPAEPELVDIAGSWKHGRDAAEAGLLLPFDPVPGTTVRQEEFYGEAEDVIEILSVTASETSPGGACTDTCLETRDFTSLGPDVEGHKFYLPGVGLIVEVDPESGERLEPIEFVPGS